MYEKLKSKNMQKRAVSEYFDVENGAMLTTHLFRYTSD